MTDLQYSFGGALAQQRRRRQFANMAVRIDLIRLVCATKLSFQSQCFDLTCALAPAFAHHAGYKARDKEPVRIPAPIAYIVLYVALYAAFGAASPFWPQFFETRALASQQIGLILAAAMLTRLVFGPLVAMLADRLGSLRLVLAGCAAVAAAAAVALLWADKFWFLLLVALVQAAALAPTTSIADALSVNTARPRFAGRPFEYGWIRGTASAAFVLGTLIAGQLVSPADLTPVIWMNAAFLIAAAGATALLPGQARSQRSRSFVVSEMKALISVSQFRIMIIASALIYGSHAVHDAFAVIRWSDADISISAISFLWSEAVVAEVLVFMLAGPPLLDRVGVRGAAILAAAAGIVRWSVAGVTTSVLLLSLIQPLHGVTFALLHLACMRMMGSLVAARVAATAQSLYAFGSGVLTAVLTFLSGELYASHGGAAFFPMAALCVLALPFAWFGFANGRC